MKTLKALVGYIGRYLRSFFTLLVLLATAVGTLTAILVGCIYLNYVFGVPEQAIGPVVFAETLLTIFAAITEPLWSEQWEEWARHRRYARQAAGKLTWKEKYKNWKNRELIERLNQPVY